MRPTPEPSSHASRGYKRVTGWSGKRRASVWMVTMIPFKKVLVGVLAIIMPTALFSALYVRDNPTFIQNSLFFPTQWLGLYTENNVTEATHGNDTQLKKILYWNNFFDSKDYYFGTGQQPFLDAGCPVSACYATYDRDQFPLEELDALIWHARSIDTSLPTVRYPQTLYVFFLEESPKNAYLDLVRYRDVFNLTMTYRRDSDIFAPYGRFERLQAPQRNEEGVLTNYAKGKTKMAAWFVTNCKTKSDRETLVSLLQEHISVDIYGACGPLTCSKQSGKKCFDMLSLDYRFYLSFENSLCKDYVTEKFFGVAKYNVIPIVYGLAPYSEIAPNNSYVNVLDFASVKDLADHLTYLSQNDTAYNEYFRWREEYRVIQSEARRWCQLCEKLHEEHPVSTYDIHQWYIKDKCLDTSNEKFNSLFRP